MTPNEWTQGLRDMADWFDQNPDDIPTYNTITVNLFADSKAELAEYARKFGKADKDISGDWFVVSKRFGPHSIDANVPREEVCRKVITGTREVPARVVPACTEEIVEWVCDEPLLAGTSTA